MDVARGGSKEEVCEVLEQHTKQETELTEVSQLLWFVGQFSGHNYDRTSNKEVLPPSACVHVHAHTHTHTRAHSLINSH